MPRTVDHEARRLELVQAAFSVFDAEGYGAVSMRGLARGLGVTTGTLYHYFEGKEDLFRAVVQQRFEQDLVDATAALPRDAPPEIRLAHLGRWVSENLDHLQATLRVVLDFHRQGGSTDGFISEVLDGYEGPLREAVGEELAGPALSLMLGLLVHRLLRGGQADVTAHLLVLAGLVDG